jgi:Fic family protein
MSTYLRTKTVNSKPYLYFQYILKLEGKRYLLSEYVGKVKQSELPRKLAFFFTKVYQKQLELLPQKWKDYFKPKSVKTLEESRFRYHLLHHEFFQKDLKLFHNLFAILFILNSNRSEGSEIKRENLEKVVQSKRKAKTIIEIEAKNSINALNFAFSKEMKWNLKSIKAIHALLMERLSPEIAGKFKKEDNTVFNQETTSWKKVREELSALLKWFKEEKKTAYPPILALEFHTRFEKIHPFIDGNGRVGRILLNTYLKQSGYRPIIFFTENHKAYCNAISAARQGRPKKLAHYLIEQDKKTSKRILEYKNEGIIKGGSKDRGQWELKRKV